MVTERKEPTVSSVLSSKENPAANRMRTPISPQPQAVEKEISSLSIWIALLIALIAIGISGISYWQLAQAQDLLQDQQTSLQSQQKRIAELESRLALSDDESSQSLVAFSTKLKEADAEIRKLWGVSYDTNRKAIEANKTAIEANKTAIASQVKNYQTLDKTLQAQQMALNNSNQRLSEQELLIRTLRERVDEQANNLKSATVAANDSRKRIENNEEAIKAFDIFRRSVSRDLLEIKQQLKPPMAR